MPIALLVGLQHFERAANHFLVGPGSNGITSDYTAAYINHKAIGGKTIDELIETGCVDGIDIAVNGVWHLAGRIPNSKRLRACCWC